MVRTQKINVAECDCVYIIIKRDILLAKPQTQVSVQLSPMAAEYSPFCIRLKMELLMHFPASNDVKYVI